jgi:hypothetical protein
MSATKVGAAADSAAAIREQIRVLTVKLQEIEEEAESANRNSEADSWTFEGTGEAEPASDSVAETDIDGVAEPAIDFPEGVTSMTQWGMTIIEHGQENTYKGRSYHSIVESSAERDRGYVKWILGRASPGGLVTDFQKYITYHQLLNGKKTGVCIPGTSQVRRYAKDSKQAASSEEKTRTASSRRD